MLFRSLLSESDAITSDKRHTNYKSHLQEYVQNAFRTHPVYRIRSEYGPDHSKHFMVEVMVGRRTLGEGRGHNKKEAEQAAARDALEKVEKVRRATRDESDEVVVEVVPEETPRERGRERGRGRHDEERGGRGRSRGRGDEDEREHPAAVVRTPAPPVLPNRNWSTIPMRSATGCGTKVTSPRLDVAVAAVGADAVGMEHAIPRAASLRPSASRRLAIRMTSMTNATMLR